MRNKPKTTSQRITALVSQMPYFTLKNLRIAGISPHYLRVFLSRQVKNGRVVRLKQGFYVSQRYLEEAKASGQISALLEFLACIMYVPAYLSGEYVLYAHNMLTEVPQNFTLMTRNKTARFSNALGNFIYHSIQERLFKGFGSVRKGAFIISIATKAKALFDFLYVRKNLIASREEFNELRLNLEPMSTKDKKEFNIYIELESSAKMRQFFSWLK